MLLLISNYPVKSTGEISLPWPITRHWISMDILAFAVRKTLFLQHISLFDRTIKVMVDWMQIFQEIKRLRSRMLKKSTISSLVFFLSMWWITILLTLAAQSTQELRSTNVGRHQGWSKEQNYFSSRDWQGQSLWWCGQLVLISEVEGKRKSSGEDVLWWRRSWKHPKVVFQVKI